MAQGQAKQPATLRRATPVLRVAGYRRSRAFYTSVLGFPVAEERGDRPRLGSLERGAAVAFVDAWHGPPATPQAGGSACLHAAPVDSPLAGIRDAGVAVTRPFARPVQGMLGFEVIDSGGNVPCFGEGDPGEA